MVGVPLWPPIGLAGSALGLAPTAGPLSGELWPACLSGVSALGSLVRWRLGAGDAHRAVCVTEPLSNLTYVGALTLNHLKRAGGLHLPFLRKAKPRQNGPHFQNHTVAHKISTWG